MRNAWKTPGHRIDIGMVYIYLLIYHLPYKNQLNAGKYAIHWLVFQLSISFFETPLVLNPRIFVGRFDGFSSRDFLVGVVQESHMNTTKRPPLCSNLLQVVCEWVLGT